MDKKGEAEGLCQNEIRFTRKDICEASGLSNSQVSVHLDRLVELEYVYAHYGKNGQRYVYELVFDGATDNDQRQLIGLLDVEHLNEKKGINGSTTPNLPVDNDDLPACFR